MRSEQRNNPKGVHRENTICLQIIFKKRNRMSPDFMKGSWDLKKKKEKGRRRRMSSNFWRRIVSSLDLLQWKTFSDMLGLKKFTSPTYFLRKWMRKAKQGNKTRKRKTWDTEKRKSNIKEEKWYSGYSGMTVKGDPQMTTGRVEAVRLRQTNWGCCHYAFCTSNDKR